MEAAGAVGVVRLAGGRTQAEASHATQNSCTVATLGRLVDAFRRKPAGLCRRVGCEVDTVFVDCFGLEVVALWRKPSAWNLLLLCGVVLFSLCFVVFRVCAVSSLPDWNVEHMASLACCSAPFPQWPA